MSLYSWPNQTAPKTKQQVICDVTRVQLQAHRKRNIMLTILNVTFARSIFNLFFAQGNPLHITPRLHRIRHTPASVRLCMQIILHWAKNYFWHFEKPKQGPCLFWLRPATRLPSPFYIFFVSFNLETCLRNGLRFLDKKKKKADDKSGSGTIIMAMVNTHMGTIFLMACKHVNGGNSLENGKR